MTREEFDSLFDSLEHIGQNREELWEVIMELNCREVRSMIEIGVSRGGSMKIWDTVIGAGHIIGVDNEDRITSSNEQGTHPLPFAELYQDFE
jgi:hypothetical protein